VIRPGHEVILELSSELGRIRRVGLRICFALAGRRHGGIAKETGHQESWQGARCDPWCWVLSDSRNVYAIAQTVIAAKFREVRSFECGFCPMFQNPLRAGSRKPLNLYGRKWPGRVFRKQMFVETSDMGLWRFESAHLPTVVSITTVACSDRRCTSSGAVPPSPV
jgi:hypothetical protein